MINVTKKGIIPKEEIFLYKVSCPICGTEFECELRDFALERRIDGEASIHCPICRRSIVYSHKALENIKIIAL